MGLIECSSKPSGERGESQKQNCIEIDETVVELSANTRVTFALHAYIHTFNLFFENPNFYFLQKCFM